MKEEAETIRVPFKHKLKDDDRARHLGLEEQELPRQRKPQAKRAPQYAGWRPNHEDGALAKKTAQKAKNVKQTLKDPLIKNPAAKPTSQHDRQNKTSFRQDSAALQIQN